MKNQAIIIRRIAHNLRKIRRARGLTQDDVEHASGVSIRLLETERQGVLLASLEKIASALGVDPSELLAPIGD